MARRSTESIQSLLAKLRQAQNEDVSPKRRVSVSASNSNAKSASFSTHVPHSQDKQKRSYLHHLEQWALNHDSAPHFHGSIYPVEPPTDKASIDLWQSVTCVLCTHNSDVRTKIIIRLFPPRDATSRYSMVVRSGSGWTPAKAFFEKEYFHQINMSNQKLEYFTAKSKHVGPKPDSASTVKIQPLFHPFLRLPIELQDMILAFAVHKQPVFEPVPGGGFRSEIALPKDESSSGKPSKVMDLSLVSRNLQARVIPWFYRSTNFYFQTHGLTLFLWCAGPVGRTNIRKMTLNFGLYSLLHCLRWLAPDPVFDLFNPPLYSALQLYWRLEIQQLLKEVKLDMLTLVVSEVPRDDIAFVTRLIVESFGHVKWLRLVLPENKESVWSASKYMEEFKKTGLTWGVLCRAAFVSIQEENAGSLYLSHERRKASVEDLDRAMQKNADFFEQ